MTSSMGLNLKTKFELSSKIRVVIQDRIAETVNCMIVSTKGSFITPNFVTATIWLANKIPDKSASPSPIIASVEDLNIDPLSPAIAIKNIPTTQKIAAIILYLSGLTLFVNQ